MKLTCWGRSWANPIKTQAPQRKPMIAQVCRVLVSLGNPA